MPNLNATLTLGLTYPGPAGEVITRRSEALAMPFLAQETSGIDVPDATALGTEIDVPFGGVSDFATLALVKNKTGQDLKVKLNGNPPSHNATLVAGTVSFSLPAGWTNFLGVQLGSAHGTPGILAVHIAGGNVIVQSWLVGTGIQVADTSDVVVFDMGAIDIDLPDQGLMIITSPTEPAAGRLTAIKLYTTAIQAGDGSVESRVFGDPG